MKRVTIGLAFILVLGVGFGGGFAAGNWYANRDTSDERSVDDWWTEARPTANRFYDAYDTASSTGRLALGPVVTEMQAARREFLAVPCPDEALEAQEKIDRAMTASIDLFQAFMSGGDEAVTPEMITDLERAWTEVSSELDALGLVTATEEPDAEPTRTRAAPTAEPYGSRTNPVPMNTYYLFDNGRVKITNVIDPYTPMGQYSEVDPGMRIIALDIDYECETEDPNDSCSWTDVMAGALVSATGTVNDDISWFESEPNSFTEQEAYSGNLLQGYIFLQVPEDEESNLIRMNVNFEQVFFVVE